MSLSSLERKLHAFGNSFWQLKGLLRVYISSFNRVPLFLLFKLLSRLNWFLSLFSVQYNIGWKILLYIQTSKHL